MVYLLLKISLTIYLVSISGPIYGIILLIVLNYLLDLFIRVTFRLDYMNTTDKNSFYDQKSNRCNIFGSLVFERCDPEIIRDVF